MAKERDGEYNRDGAARSEQVAPHGLSGTLTNRPPAFKPALSIAAIARCQEGRLRKCRRGLLERAWMRGERKTNNQ